ncbi:LacI family DNA-binding transcriptional regulator [Silvibacterium dinghuense]|uniref:LacI family transcriptional regulator n=1 Tax=Silvibacterium dinghuense TaxID=1560006 RepID=A0A4Q1SE06_9BACT|nr:LacI family DNA-binding transcriptional regulator [Silvibacterium dinghuense]RXS95353.1 LacI family transcriptional regulator [Silvibacterium dinghuense]GGH12617.1 DNA-binding transcriptional regulator CytR [Silvibacterium dinghuense]
MVKKKPESDLEQGPINLRQLSELLHLSQTTISLVLNDSPAAKSIPEHTRARVFEAARKFQYRPNYFARSLRRSKSMSVGVLAPDLSEGYFTLVMQGVEETLLRSHYFYFTASHYWQTELMREYPRMLAERAVDGYLLLNTPAAFSSPLPTVAISAHHDAAGVTNVVLDHHRAAELALRHLYELGHRHIAFVKGPEIIPDTEYRWKSILQVAKSLDIKVLPELSIQLPADSWSPEIGYQPMKALLERTRAFTAIFCFNDISAIGAIRAIHDAGLSVPGDVSVVGFDDIISAAYQKPSLTTVRQPLREMGSEGAQLLLALIADPKKPQPAEVLMQPELIVRESTGPAPARSGAGSKRTPAKRRTR